MAANKRARLNELLTKSANIDNQIKAICDTADSQGRTETPDEIAQIKALNAENMGYLDETAELKSLLDIRSGIENRETAGKAVNKNGHPNGAVEGQVYGTFKSLGERFTEDVELKSWLENQGRSIGRRKIDSPRVEVKSFWDNKHLRTLITNDSQGAQTSAGAFVFPDFKPIVDQFYQRPLTLRDLLTIGETGSDTIEYVRVTGVTNNAAGVAQAANTTDGDASGRKPESAMAFERVVENVKTIAHWIPVTSRALEDAPQLRSYVDSFLRYGIDEALEDQLLAGAGGDDLTGILETPDIQVQPFVDDIFASTRKARTLVRTVGRTTPTAYLMNPNDWELIDLAKDGNDRYYYGGPQAPGQRTLWGLPVVECEALPEGTALCANFKMGILWDRLQSGISVSNSHNDFFVRNLVAILCEARMAFGLIRPQAFVQVSTQDPS